MITIKNKVIKMVKYVASGVGMLLVFFFILVLYPFKKVNFPLETYEVLAINNVAIIDVERDTVYQNKFIRIRAGIIETISDTFSVKNSSSHVKQIDGQGKYLTPAFWDMHVHLTRRSPDIAYPEFIRHGVTHVRDMRGAYNDTDPFAGEQGRLEKWNDEVLKFKILGPKLHGYTSFAVDGPHSMFEGQPDFFNAATPGDAVKLVQYFALKKVTLIKAYNNIPRQAFFTLMKEAKRYGIEVSGHKPVRVSTIEAANAGMKSMEHARSFLWDSFSGSGLLVNDTNPMQKVNTSLMARMIEEHDTILLKQNFDAFIKNKTWYCPTHLTRKADAYAEDKIFRKRFKDINPILRFLSFEDLDANIQEDRTAFGRKVFKDFYLKGLLVSGKAYNAGVKILAGSDVPELPGSSLHEELIELSKAGLPNGEILRTATLYPAQYYDLEKTYGTVSVGKKADLVLLTGNPLVKIENTNLIAAVIVDGRYMDSKFLGRIERKIKDRQTSILLSAKLLWDMARYMMM